MFGNDKCSLIELISRRIALTLQEKSLCFHLAYQSIMSIHSRSISCR